MLALSYLRIFIITLSLVKHTCIDMVNTEIIACYLVALECKFKTVEVYPIYFLLNILKRSHDCLLHTKKDRNCDLFAVKITACTTFTSRENVLNTSCYFYLPRIFYEWKYTITWLLWTTFDMIVCEVQKHIESSWSPWKQAWFATFVVLMTIVGSLGHVLMV